MRQVQPAGPGVWQAVVFRAMPHMMEEQEEQVIQQEIPVAVVEERLEQVMPEKMVELEAVQPDTVAVVEELQVQPVQVRPETEMPPVESEVPVVPVMVVEQEEVVPVEETEQHPEPVVVPEMRAFPVGMDI